MRPRRIALEHLVREIEERRDVEDPGHRHGRERQDARIRRGHVVVEDAHRSPGARRRTRTAAGAQERRHRDAQRPVGSLVAPREQQDADQSHHDVRQPGREPRRHQAALGQRRPQIHRDVVGEDDDQADREAAERAVAPVGGAERDADQPEHQTGHRNRPLAVDGDQLVVRRLAPASPSRPPRRAARRWSSRSGRARARWETRSAGSSDTHETLELQHLVGAAAVGRVPRAVFEHQFDRAAARWSIATRPCRAR